MNKVRYKIPSISSLTAFESSARLLNFSRAADNLHTSQSAISRHIAELENKLGVKLFLRQNKRLHLTEHGATLHRAVISGFDQIETAINTISGWSIKNELTISCTHEISHLHLMPRFEALKEAVGDNVEIRIVTNEYDAIEHINDPRIDIAFKYSINDSDLETDSVMFHEAVRPVCSPAFYAKHKSKLSKPPTHWSGIPLLKLTKLNKGWATWEDWFAVSGEPELVQFHSGYDNYVYLLEAAAAGRGLALGWQGLTERYLNGKTLVPVCEKFVRTENMLSAYLTNMGKNKKAAIICLNFLSSEPIV
jgi:LysR family transcriptional regulator, glycine cleavage system transcriptional activator